MGKSIEFRCPSCGDIASIYRDRPSELPQTGTEVACSVCGKKVNLPETIRFVRNPLSSTTGQWTTSSSSEFSDYWTLLFIGKINSFVGWLGVIGGGILFVVGLASGPFGLLGITPGLLLSIIGLLVVGFGQTIPCFVDTERHTRASSETLKQILDEMTERSDPRMKTEE